MGHNWKTTILDSEEETLRVLAELQGKPWLCRGHAECSDGLASSIDRKLHQNLSRGEKLTLERQSIDEFRLRARFFASQSERNALFNDITTLILMRHYKAPTRLLDWSESPYVAAYFAVEEGNDAEDGQIWSFDRDRFGQDGEDKQWRKWPETTIDGSGDGLMFRGEMTAFKIDEPPDWFTCYFYRLGFPRQDAQHGAYTMTARFGRDHAEAIEEFFNDRSYHHLYVIPARLKPPLRQHLIEKYGICRGLLFPDAAGAAETAGMVFPGDVIDGKLVFQGDAAGKFETVILSVKAGHVTANHVRDLRGVVEREKAAIGVLISMEDPTKPMQTEAVTAEFYESKMWNKKYPKIQLLTVADLLAGKQIDMPPVR